MKYRWLSAALVCCATAQVAQAAPSPDPGFIGALQGVADYCTQVDSQDAAIFAGAVARQLRGLGAKGVSALRASPDYQQLYQFSYTLLQQSVDPALAPDFCRRAVRELVSVGGGAGGGSTTG